MKHVDKIYIYNFMKTCCQAKYFLVELLYLDAKIVNLKLVFLFLNIYTRAFSKIIKLIFKLLTKITF